MPWGNQVINESLVKCREQRKRILPWFKGADIQVLILGHVNLTCK